MELWNEALKKSEKINGLQGLPSRELTYPPFLRHIWVDDFPNFPIVGFLLISLGGYKFQPPIKIYKWMFPKIVDFPKMDDL